MINKKTIFALFGVIAAIGALNMISASKPTSAQVATSTIGDNEEYFRHILAHVFDGQFATLPLEAMAISKTEYSSDLLASLPLQSSAIGTLSLSPRDDSFSVNAAFDQMRSVFSDGPIGAADNLSRYAVSHVQEREISVYVFQSESGVSVLFLRDL